MAAVAVDRIEAERELEQTRRQLSSLRVEERRAMRRHMYALAEKLRWQIDACERHIPRLERLVAELTVAELGEVAL